MAERPSRTEMRNSGAMMATDTEDGKAPEHDKVPSVSPAPQQALTAGAPDSVASTTADKANATSQGTVEPAKNVQVLTVDQLMAKISRGQIRLASTTATTADHKALHINDVLKMAAQQSNFAKSIQKRSRAFAEGTLKSQHKQPLKKNPLKKTPPRQPPKASSLTNASSSQENFLTKSSTTEQKQSPKEKAFTNTSTAELNKQPKENPLTSSPVAEQKPPPKEHSLVSASVSQQKLPPKESSLTNTSTTEQKAPPKENPSIKISTTEKKPSATETPLSNNSTIQRKLPPKENLLMNTSTTQQKLPPKENPPMNISNTKQKQIVSKPRATTRVCKPSPDLRRPVGLEFTSLTEPPPGYMTVFIPVEQSSRNIKPILLPKSSQGFSCDMLKVSAEIESDESDEDDLPMTGPLRMKVNGPHAMYCNVCSIYYSPLVADMHQHDKDDGELANLEPEDKPPTVTDANTENRTPVKTNENIAKIPTETNSNSADIVTENDHHDDADVDMDSDIDNDDIVDHDGDDDDDDDDDVDYRPRSSVAKRKVNKATKPAAASKQSHSGVSDKPVVIAQDSVLDVQVHSVETPKCIVCGKPYISFNQHLACSGARANAERNARESRLKVMELNRAKRRRRVHRFLRRNFTLHSEIPDPPKNEFVDGNLVRDVYDNAEDTFETGDDRPALALTCYVCPAKFENDLEAYHHYTLTKCGPKYINKVLFRSRNRAENRPHNYKTERALELETNRFGRLKRHQYNVFKEKHTINDDGTLKKHHICTACGDSFASEENVKEHYEREHRWRCKLCGDIYVHMKGVQLHYNRSHGKSYCILCHVIFDSAALLQIHMRTHQKRLCDLCGQVLASKHHYNKHMLLQHNIAHAEPLHNQIVKTKPQPRGLCEICGKEYSWPFLRSKHMASHMNPKPPKQRRVKLEQETEEVEQLGVPVRSQPVERKPRGNVVYPFRCSICSRGFQRSFYYNQHLERHAKGLACDKCGLFFAPHVDRQKHLSECLKNICAECGEECSTKEALKRHKQCHPDQPVRCKVCNREFATQFLLNNHFHVHKQYQCKLCAKRFSSVDHVVKHKCFGKKFECRLCGQKFSSIRMSKQHGKMEHHRESMDLFIKRRVEFHPPDEELSPKCSPVAVRMTSTVSAMPAPIPGPSHTVISAQPSMTAHEVSQALMTLHDLPMSGYSPLPINMAREGRDTSRDAQIQGQLCKFPPGTTLSSHPPHPPPGYPGSYFSSSSAQY